MNTLSVIMIQLSNRAWTLVALQSACQMARATAAKIALVQLIPVQHPSLLGTDSGYVYFSEQAQRDFAEYQAVVEDNGIACEPLLFQYASLVEATTQAAQHVGASVVFARIPDSVIPLRAKFQGWLLQRGLAAQGCRWIQQPEDSVLIPVPVMAVVTASARR